MSEVWKPIKGYEGIYEVSSYGRVRSLERTIAMRNQHGEYVRVEKGGIMAQKLQNTDRLQVSLRKVVNGKRLRKTFYVHRLVAEAFVPNSDGSARPSRKPRATVPSDAPACASTGGWSPLSNWSSAGDIVYPYH